MPSAADLRTLRAAYWAAFNAACAATLARDVEAARAATAEYRRIDSEIAAAKAARASTLRALAA